MRDLEQAIRQLHGHTLALCRGEAVVLSDKRGVAPLADFIREGRSFPGYAAADRVVGKASAMLLIKVGVTAVYAGILSQAAADLLEAHGVYAQYHTLVSGIMNRDKTSPCPMEQAAAAVTDPAEALPVLRKAMQELQKQ